MNLFKPITNSFGYMKDFIAQVVSKYHIHYDEQNALARAGAKQQKISIMIAQAQAYFNLVLNVFVNSLANCAERVGATMPRYPYKLIAVPNIGISKQGFPVYRFRFCYRRGGLIAAQIKRIIQLELCQECYVRGLPLLVVIGVHLGADGIAIVQVAWYSQLQAAKELVS